MLDTPSPGFFFTAFKEGSHFKEGSQGLPMWSKGVLNYDSGICCFKEVKNTARLPEDLSRIVEDQP